MSLPEVYRIIPPLCSAVDYAAGRGMVHRDIKPANIIMTEDGEPILTDYGIAKMMGSTSLTSPGTVVGSAHYMSPEQAQGQECDVRSDLYSLGVVLFECLAGTVPFDGDTTVTVLIKHISAPVPSIRGRAPEPPVRARAGARPRTCEAATGSVRIGGHSSPRNSWSLSPRASPPLWSRSSWRRQHLHPAATEFVPP